MGLPGVDIVVVGGALGGVPVSKDGITGLMLSGIAVTSKIAIAQKRFI